MGQLTALPAALFERAVCLYLRQFGAEAEYPSFNVSTFEGDVVVLRNGVLELARYVYGEADDSLRLVEE